MSEGTGAPKQPSEDEMRAAYEAELDRVTSSDMLLQTVVTLVSIGSRRLGRTGESGAQRDLEQVCDAIDGARALMPLLERRMSGELGPLRDAIAQLQIAYAREVQGARETESAPPQAPPARSDGEPALRDGGSVPPQAPPARSDGGPAEPAGQGEKDDSSATGEKPRDAGPAESSGRLWVPGR